MPRDAFQEIGISVNTPRDVFAESGISPPKKANNITPQSSSPWNIPAPEAMQQMLNPIAQGDAGALQHLGNYPIEIANLLKKNQTPLFDFAPKTTAGNIGGGVGDIASFLMPGKLAEMGIGALFNAPKIGEGLSAIQKYLARNPFANSAAKIGQAGLETGLYNAAKNPLSPGESGIEGAGAGMGVQSIANLMTNKSPLVSMLAKIAIGGGAGAAGGAMLGHPLIGATTGIGTMFGAPPVAKMFVGGNAPMLEGLHLGDVLPAKRANDRLGTVITPAQASGNYVTSGLEGDLKRVPESAQAGYRLEQQQTRGQQKAIDKMLNDIYTPTVKTEKDINDLYAKAERKFIPIETMKEMRHNPIIDRAFETVKTDAAFQKVPENGYKFLAEVDRQLHRDYKAALGTKPNTAHAINNTKNAFSEQIKTLNPDYEAATDAARPKMIRQSIEERFNKNKEDYTGKNFYNKFLNTKKSTQDMLRDTKDYPEAQQAIKDMRIGWKHLSNMKTVSQGEAQAKTGIADARDAFKMIVGQLKKIAGAKKDVQKLKFIYSKDWDKEFDRIVQRKDRNQRNRDSLALFGKIGLANGLDTDK